MAHKPWCKCMICTGVAVPMGDWLSMVQALSNLAGKADAVLRKGMDKIPGPNTSLEEALRASILRARILIGEV